MIRNGPKLIISASSGLGLLQIVSEPDTGRCANEDVGPPRRVDDEIPRRLERGTTFFIRVWKSFPNRHVLKS